MMGTTSGHSAGDFTGIITTGASVLRVFGCFGAIGLLQGLLFVFPAWGI